MSLAYSSNALLISSVRNPCPLPIRLRFADWAVAARVASLRGSTGSAVGPVLQVRPVRSSLQSPTAPRSPVLPTRNPAPARRQHHGVSLPVIRHEQVTPSLGGGEQLDDFGRDAFGKIHLIRRYSVQTIKARLKNVTSGIVAEYRTAIRTPIQYASPPMHPPNSSNRYCGNGANGVQQQCEYQIAGTDILPKESFLAVGSAASGISTLRRRPSPAATSFVSMLYSHRSCRRQKHGRQRYTQAECDEPVHRNSPVAKIGDGQYGRGNDRKQI